MKHVSSLEGAELWAAGYDESLNPLLALEMRVVAPLLAGLGVTSVLDVGCGTGRWMEWMAARGIRTIGIDASRKMLERAAAKPGLQGRCVLGVMEPLPFPGGSFDLSICSFALSYAADAASVLQETARVSRRVLISDLHPEAEAAGWTRSFRAGAESYCIDHFAHAGATLEEAARRAGLVQVFRIESHFSEPERALFATAGRAAAFDTVRRISAVMTTLWERT